MMITKIQKNKILGTCTCGLCKHKKIIPISWFKIDNTGTYAICKKCTKKVKDGLQLKTLEI